MDKDFLFGKTLTELQGVVTDLGLPKFNAAQIANWLYTKNIDTIDGMTNLSKRTRDLLSDKFEIGVSSPKKVQTSSDGTRKYLFQTESNNFIETAMIPDKERVTVCVSSQIGCKMGCKFCMTGRQGFNGQLSSGEIINQIRSIEERDNVSNIVYMGMGEPFDNIEQVLKSIEILTSEWGYAMSPRRITVSTIGVIPHIKRFLTETNCNLAISLHSPFDAERAELMPVQKIYPIKAVLEELRSFDFDNQRKLSFEYTVFGELNDTPAHVKELARILNGIKSHLNLIRFHTIPDSTLKKTDDIRLQNMKNMLNEKGILTTIRASRGQDIYAACGLLSTKEKNVQNHQS